ncbi:MAG: Do family serine endopeptidase [Gammaproteobacteria bacterium]|nr:Do family serine endopeptidase [Gammaproteobacteria bacterium]
MRINNWNILRGGRRASTVTVATTVTITVATVLTLGALTVLTAATVAEPARAAQTHVAADLPSVDVNHGFADLVAAVKPAVVNISTTGHAPGRPRLERRIPEMEEFFDRFFGQPRPGPRHERRRERDRDGDRNRPPRPYQRKTTAVGSGFIIDADGLVVTNYHVVEDAIDIEVVFDDGARIPATLKGHDKKTDLALLEIRTDKPLPFVKFGDSDAARVGDWVIAIGNPFGLGGSTTSGIISARGRDIQAGPLDDFIQIDAPINRGNSGGPLFNTRGEVIGVNSVIYSPNGYNVGIGFAIPSSMAANVIAQLRDSGVVRRGFLGVHIQAVSAEIADNLGLDKPAGALVTRVVEDSPAAAAGIEPGDVILVYDGDTVAAMRDLPKLVALTAHESQVDLVVWRDDRRLTLRVTIGRSAEAAPGDGGLADNAAGRRLGLTVAALDDDARAQYGIAADAAGVVVTEVEPDSAAARRGLRAGDLIRRIDKRAIDSPSDVAAALEASRAADKKSLLLLVERDRQTRFVVVPDAE